jgi:type VI secretion system FHA domain protein
VIALRLLRRPDGTDAGAQAQPVGPAGVTIGRASDCDLRLDDALRLVSRQHAWLVPQGDDTGLLRCISTSASLSVNGDSVLPGGERMVRCGDLLRIGGFEILIEVGRPPAIVPPSPPAVPPVQLVAPAPVVLPPPVSLAAVPPRPVRPRLDQWFDLETAADPLGPGSPLPASDDNGTRAQPVHVPPRAPAQETALAATLGSAPRRSARPSTASAANSPNAAALDAEPARPRTRKTREPPTAPTATESGATEPADRLALKRAFLRGAGLNDEAMESAVTLDAAWMEHLGSVLRVVAEGTLALLRSRAVTKRSIRAEGTRIAARANNPLKFAPDAAEALMLLVKTHSSRGFLEPVDALRDAHNDLQVHQLAMVAGMRAAVHELISRLGPEEGPARGMARYIPALHEAQLWQRHLRRHAHLLEHLDDDFDAIFGREFLRAYEAQSQLAHLSARPEDEGAPDLPSQP